MSHQCQSELYAKGPFVCPLLLDIIFPKDPTYQGLQQTLQSGFHNINEENKKIKLALQGLSETCVALVLLPSPTGDVSISHPSPCHSIRDRSRLSGWRAVLLNVSIELCFAECGTDLSQATFCGIWAAF